MSPIHHSDGNCLLCISKVKSAHPYLQKWFYDVKAKFPLVHISWAFRDKAIQNQFVKDGRSRAEWPTSKHNAVTVGFVPCSRALDIFVIDEDGAARFPPKYYVLVANWTREQNYSINWGGAWKTFPDSPHFEVTDDIVQP